MTVAGRSISNTYSGRFDVYVARLAYGTTFSADWATAYGGSYHEHVGGLVTDGTGVYVCGSFDSTSMSVNGVTLDNTDTSNNVADAWVARLVASSGDVSLAPHSHSPVIIELGRL